MGEGPCAEKRPGIHCSGSTQNLGTHNFWINYFVKNSVNEYVIIAHVRFCFCNDGCSPTSEFNAALSYSLSSVKHGDIVLKKEQREAIKLKGTSYSFAMRAGRCLFKPPVLKRAM